MFTGFSAFPLTPLKNGEIDEKAFTRLLQKIKAADVDSIGAVGSTGNYAYLSRAQRGNTDEATSINFRLEPLWTYFRQHGSLRTIATIAELDGVVASPCLPSPLLSLQGEERIRLQQIIRKLDLS